MSLIPPPTATLVWMLATPHDPLRCLAWKDGLRWVVGLFFGRELLEIAFPPDAEAVTRWAATVRQGLLRSAPLPLSEPTPSSATPARRAAAHASSLARLRHIKQGLGCHDPWIITRFRVSHDPLRLDVWVHLPADRASCPTCQGPVTISRYTRTHVFRCLLFRVETHLYARIPIVDGPAHGRTPIAVPWPADRRKWRHVRTLPPRA